MAKFHRPQNWTLFVTGTYALMLGGLPPLLVWTSPAPHISLLGTYIATALTSTLLGAIVLSVSPRFRHNRPSRQAEIQCIAATLADDTGIKSPSEPASANRLRAFVNRQIRRFPAQSGLAIMAVGTLTVSLHALLRPNADWNGTVFMGVMIGILALLILSLYHLSRAAGLDEEVFDLVMALIEDDDRLHRLQSAAGLSVFALHEDPTQIITVQPAQGRTTPSGPAAQAVIAQHWATAQRGRALLSA